ncbi:MAG: hypothetical protein CL569_07640 [Alphaproteobacteria bacterium]|nr:hypothetical protein [Alphaproteobacteria bacterium]
MPKRKITKTDAPYRLKQNRGTWYAVDKKTRKETNLKCKGTRQQAEEVAEVVCGLTDDSNAMHHMKVAEAHLAKCNPEWTTNTWDTIAQNVIHGPRGRGLGGDKKLRTVEVLQSDWNNPCWNDLRHKRCIDTTPADFTRALKGQGIAAVCFGKKLHNYAMNHRCIPYTIMGKEMWPVIRPVGKCSRSITQEEHLKLVGFLADPDLDFWKGAVKYHKGSTPKQWQEEWINWLWFLWFTGASSQDAAGMHAEQIDWDKGCVEYKRGKWVLPEEHKPARVGIEKGGEFEALLKRLPKSGPLFPLLATRSSSNRARTMGNICEWVGIPHTTPHGYRFSWAERADEGGMDVKHRMANLGHSTVEMAEHYSEGADIIPPSIEIIDGGLKAA